MKVFSGALRPGEWPGHVLREWALTSDRLEFESCSVTYQLRDFEKVTSGALSVAQEVILTLRARSPYLRLTILMLRGQTKWLFLL